MRTKDEIKFQFNPVGNLDTVSQQKLLNVTRAMEDAATELFDNVPECADRTHALRLMLDAKMWAIQAISHAPRPQVENKKVAPAAKPAPAPKGAPDKEASL